MPSRIRKNASGSDAKPSTWASGVNGRTAPIAAQAMGSAIIARLGGCAGTGRGGCG